MVHVRPDLYGLLTVHCNNMMKTVITIYINSVINAALTDIDIDIDTLFKVEIIILSHTASLQISHYLSINLKIKIKINIKRK